MFGIITCPLGLGQGAPPAALQPVNYQAQARAKFAAKKYDEAITLYRKYLRRFPRDYNTWNEIGATYYHTGLPRKALRYLKHVERKTANKSYNYYYQGLCYNAVGDPEKARQYFSYAAMRFNDEYASRSMYEMGVIEYINRDRQRANYWFMSYLQRYPSGVYRPQIARLLQSMATGNWIKDPNGAERPDSEAALFKYNKLSLSPFPHYWFFQGGGQYIQTSGQEPAPSGNLKSRSLTEMAMIANSGIGIGPWRDGATTVFGGYTYRQLWLTDDDRLNTYFDDPTDIEYFPFRADLLERHHQFYGDFRREFAGNFYYGVYGRYEFARIGSSIFPGPDDAELRKVLKISETQMLIPWIGASYLDNYRTLIYLYLRKELNDDSPEHSNKTYDMGVQSGSPFVSFGLSHNMEFPNINLEANIELFHYKFIYNDYWLDYTRDGIMVDVEHEIIPRWFISGTLGMYRDTYELERLKQRSCSSTANVTDTAASAQPQDKPNLCARVDNGRLIQAGVYWNWSQFSRFAADIQFVNNQNPQQQEFEESKQTIQVTYTLAFPSVKRVTRFADRYADTAFTKEAE